MQVGSTVEKYGFPDVERQADKALDKNAFLQLFVAQLKNQDPMNPQDSSAFMAQMAQFSTLEQITNMNQEMLNLRISQEAVEAATLLGRNVKVLAGYEEVTGQVEKVYRSGEEIQVFINGTGYNLAQVVEVYPEPQTNLSAELTQISRFQEFGAATALLDRQVRIQDGGEELTEQVEKISLVGENITLFVGGAGYTLNQVLEVM